MYNTSTTFRDLMAQPSRQLTARGVITFSDNTTQAITAAEIVYIQINEDAGAHLPLGGFAASSLSLHLDNRQGEWNPGGSLLGSRTLDGAIVKLEVGVKGATDYEYANLGIFVLEDAIGQEQEPVIVLRGADFLANKAEHPFSDNMTYPRTLSQLLTEVCAQAGITLKTPIFINSSVSLPIKPKWEEGTTCRGVIGYIACCAAGFARIDRNGHLEIVSFEHTPDYSVGTDRYIKLERQGAIFGPFNALSVYPYGAPHGYGATRIAADLNLVDNELNSIAVKSNPLLEYQSPVFNSLIETMRSTLNGLTFHGGAIEWQGDPTLTTGDVAGVTDLAEETLSLMILYQTITLDSGFSMQSGNKLTTNIKGQAKQEFVRVFTPTGKLNATALEGDINIHAGEQVNVLAGGQIVMEAADAIVLSTGKGVDTALSEKAASGDVTNLTTRVTHAEQKITPAAITATVRNHADYKSDLAGKNRTFVGGTPTGMIAGDLWIDSANGNLLKRYNGSSWVAVQDGAISLAQQQADKIQWLVASGTSATNMTLTSQLYSLMAENINLSANNSIKLTVSNIQVGGKNYVRDAGKGYTVLTYNTDVNPGGYSIDPQLVVDAKGKQIVVSFDFWYATWLQNSERRQVHIRCKKTDNTEVYLVASVPKGYSVANADNNTFQRWSQVIDFPVDVVSILDCYYYVNVLNYTIFKNLKIEVANKATAFSYHPDDPASGVKAAGIEITPGRMRQYASLDYEGIFGSGATEMGMANKRADGIGLWLGGSPSTAKNRQWMNGVAQFQEIRVRNNPVNQLGQVYTYYQDGIGGPGGVAFDMFFYVPAALAGISSLRIYVQCDAPMYYTPGSGLARDTAIYPGASGRYRLQVDGYHYAGANEGQTYDYTGAMQFDMSDSSPITTTGRDITALLRKSGSLIARDMHYISLQPVSGHARFMVTLVFSGVGTHPASAPN